MQSKTADGTTYSTKDGNLLLATVGRPLDGASLGDVLRNFQTRTDGSRVTYSKLTAGSLVVSGQGPQRSYYARLTNDGGRMVGYQVIWTPQYRDLGTLTAVFAASTVAPVQPPTTPLQTPLVDPLPNNVDDQRVGAFVLPSGDSQAIVLDGDITSSAPLDFLRALRERPDAKTVSLNSNGGLVSPALLVAHEVHARALSTEVRVGAGCYSACAYIYFAGVQRLDHGALGVHQIYGDKVTAESAQMSLSDVLDELTDFDVSQGIVSVMLRTPPDQIHVFTGAEIASLGIDKPGDAKEQQSAAEQAAPTIDPASAACHQSLLLEASDDGVTGAVPFSGTVDWSKDVDENGLPTLIGMANIPARNLSVDMLIRKNSDPNLPASYLIEINFNVSDSFIGGSIAGLAGVLLKNDELVQGALLVGASARVVGNSFLFALSAAPQDSTANVKLLTTNKWMDLALIYASGKRAIITLEKDESAQKLFSSYFTQDGSMTSAVALTNEALASYLAKTPH